MVGPFINTTTNVGKTTNGYYTYVLGNLDPEMFYEVYISAVNMVGTGEPTLQVIETEPLDEPLGESKNNNCTSMFQNKNEFTCF